MHRTYEHDQNMLRTRYAQTLSELQSFRRAAMKTLGNLEFEKIARVDLSHKILDDHLRDDCNIELGSFEGGLMPDLAFAIAQSSVPLLVPDPVSMIP